MSCTKSYTRTHIHKVSAIYCDAESKHFKSTQTLSRGQSQRSQHQKSNTARKTKLLSRKLTKLAVIAVRSAQMLTRSHFGWCVCVCGGHKNAHFSLHYQKRCSFLRRLHMWGNSAAPRVKQTSLVWQTRRTLLEVWAFIFRITGCQDKLLFVLVGLTFQDSC